MRGRGSIAIQVNRILTRLRQVVVRSLSTACWHLDSNLMTSSVSWKPHDNTKMNLLDGHLTSNGGGPKDTLVFHLATIRIKRCVVRRRVGCNAGAILGIEEPLRVMVHL